MKQYSYVFHAADDLMKSLAVLEHQMAEFQKDKVLFELFSYTVDNAFNQQVIAEICQKFSGAQIIGTSTSGEIADDHIYENTVVLTVLCFQDAYCSVIGIDCQKDAETAAGQTLRDQIMMRNDVKGVEILADMKNMNNAVFFAQLDSLPAEINIFGGGSDAYDNSKNIVVFDQDHFYHDGAVAAVFCGSNLQIQTTYSLGWKSLGREMEITSVSPDGMILQTIDHMPPTEMYHRYLNLRTDQDFHETVDKFPIMLQRNGHDMARVPISNNEDGSIVLGADVKIGEKMKLGYGDPSMLMEQAQHSADELAVMSPQGILLFSCITRKAFLKDYASSDAAPFAHVSPVTGFYTYGEIMRISGRVETMNCTLVCVGIREGITSVPKQLQASSQTQKLSGYMSVIDRLINFVEATTADLEEANRQLQYYAAHDRLTGMLNRGEIESRMKSVMSAVSRSIYTASVLMFDIDDFKMVNDTYGHDAGDSVLRDISEILKNVTRTYDSIGRWGGEEFLVVMPAAAVDDAVFIAERIRNAIDCHAFAPEIHATISLGVTQIIPGEEEIELYQRVDAALYEAKHQGKNRTVKR